MTESLRDPEVLKAEIAESPRVRRMLGSCNDWHSQVLVR